MSTPQYPATLPAGSPPAGTLDVTSLAALAWPTDSGADDQDDFSGRTQRSAGLAAGALATGPGPDLEPEVAITDLVVNLAHLTDALGLDWLAIMGHANRCYLAELYGDR